MPRVSAQTLGHQQTLAVPKFFLLDILNYVSFFFTLDHRISHAPKKEHSEVSNEINTSGVCAFLQENKSLLHFTPFKLKKQLPKFRLKCGS